jgi:hypothetical protein
LALLLVRVMSSHIHLDFTVKGTLDVSCPRKK